MQPWQQADNSSTNVPELPVAWQQLPLGGQFAPDVAHNEPTEELMDDAKRQMQEAALWSVNDTFLAQPIVKEVLEELGELEPTKLLENLLAEVRSRVVTVGP